MLMRATITLLSLIFGGLAQNHPVVDGPVLGYVLHAGSLHALVGIPGAVTWGRIIASELETAAVSPAQNVAIACAQGRAFVVLLERPDERVPLFEGACTRIVFSHGGRAAVIHDEPAQQLRVITTLTAAPAVVREVSWAGKISAIAITDDASQLVVASGDATFAVPADGAHRVLPGVGAASAIAISRQSAWISGQEQNILLEIDLEGEAASVRSSVALPPAAALSLSWDSTVLVMIDKESKQPVLWDIAQSGALRVEGTCEADSVQALHGNTVFRLIAANAGSCIVDGDRDPPKIFRLPGAPQ
jgi:hypothetical protein